MEEVARLLGRQAQVLVDQISLISVDLTDCRELMASGEESSPGEGLMVKSVSRKCRSDKR